MRYWKIVDKSQNGESLWLNKYILQNDKYPKTKYFLDVGAFDGTRNSNSYFFLRSGWNVTYFEPNIHSFKTLLVSTHGFRKQCTYYNVAVGSRFEIKRFKPVFKLGHQGRSAINKDGKLQVVVVPLTSLISCNPFIMSLDIEGYECEVLKDIENTIYPNYLIIEANSKDEADKQDKYLTKYTQINTMGVNRIFKCKEKLE